MWNEKRWSIESERIYKPKKCKIKNQKAFEWIKNGSLKNQKALNRLKKGNIENQKAFW